MQKESDSSINFQSLKYMQSSAYGPALQMCPHLAASA